MMKPILFNVEMVRAILNGRKTVTRRIIPERIQEAWYDYDEWATDQCNGLARAGIPCERSYEADFYESRAPFYPGDILYVRETWARVKFGLGEWHYEYRADSTDPKRFSNGSFAEWHPSIHMPKEATRIWLCVKDVRVERLQDMSEDDVVAEGAELLIQCPNEHRVYDRSGALIGMCWNEDVCSGGCDFIDKSYGELFGEIVWDGTIKAADRDKYGWAANPWVWVIEFERCEKPKEAVDGSV